MTMVIMLATGTTTMMLKTVNVAIEIAAINKIVTTATLATILHQNLVCPEGRRDQRGILHKTVGIRDKS